MRSMKAAIVSIGFAVVAVALLVISMPGCSGSPRQEARQAAYQIPPSSAYEITTATWSATVQAVDPATRTVTLKNFDGQVRTFKLGPDVGNFGQIKVGDRFCAIVTDELAISLTKGTAAPAAISSGEIAVAPIGGKPGAVMTQSAIITDRITAIDPAAHAVTLQGVSGQSRTVRVDRGVDLSALQVGDQVTLRCASAMALTLDVPVTAEEAQNIGSAAYIYGYPLLTMDVTREVMTNVPRFDAAKMRAPMFQFSNAAHYPTAAFKDVTAPNADTLYSTAWLNLSREPWVLHIPDMGDRYYLMPMLDAWTNVFADPGKRTGVRGGDFAITGPGWRGELPPDVKEIHAPTNLVWILGRIYCTGTAQDYDAVHALQAQLSLRPLSRWGQAYTPPEMSPVDESVNMASPPRNQVNAMPAAAFFSRMTMLMKQNPPSPLDGPMLARLARVGIFPGQAFDLSKVDPVIAQGLIDGQKAGLDRILAGTSSFGKKVNGWQIAFTGDYGADYQFRAVTAFVGLGANRAQDACYPLADVDGDNRPLEGANRYVWHFSSRDRLPPVNGFWSLTMYDSQYYFVDNPLNRYTLSQRDSLKANPDGSIDLYLQKDNPGPERESNWLPAPDGRFALCLRLYWPKQAFLSGQWSPPPVMRAP